MAVSTYTLGQAKTYTREDLAAKSTKFYSDSIIDRHVKAAYRKFCQDLKFHQTFATESSVIDQFEYGWPDCIFEILRMSYDGQYLVKRNEDWLWRRDFKWRSAASGTPVMWIPISKTRYALYTKPDAVKTIRIEGYGIPDLPANDNATFTLPVEFEDMVITLACARASRQDSQGQGAQQYGLFMSEYRQRLSDALMNIHADEDTVVGEDRLGTGVRRVGPPVTILDFGGSITP